MNGTKMMPVLKKIYEGKISIHRSVTSEIDNESELSRIAYFYNTLLDNKF